MLAEADRSYLDKLEAETVPPPSVERGRLRALLFAADCDEQARIRHLLELPGAEPEPESHAFAAGRTRAARWKERR